MSGQWTVKLTYSPLDKPRGQPALVNGNAFGFVHGDKLDRVDEKTVSEEKDGVIIRQWFWLKDGPREGYVPYNPIDPTDVRSVATEWKDDMPAPFQFHLFDAEIDRDTFAENCLRKGIRWQVNAAYLYALAFIESGEQWPAGKVNSPSAKPGELTAGTFQFLPATWKTLVDKFSSDQQISGDDTGFPEITADDIAFPEPQVTFAASQAGDAIVELEKQLGHKPRYVDLRLAHLLTIKGAVAVLDAANANKTVDAILDAVLSDLDAETRKSRIAALLQRKGKILKDAAGKPVSAKVLLQNCIAELDAGFLEVKNAASAMIGAQPSAQNDAGSQTADDKTLGVLSEEFESQGDPAAIGFDSTGGWSYGKYQIASKKGRFEDFLDWLAKDFQDLRAKLIAAGGDAAARAGNADFRTFWKSLKSRDDFVPAQHGFIKATHYDVMVKQLKKVLDVEARSIALRNVVWSVAVQHGPFSGIIAKAVTNVGSNSDDKALINAIYKERSRVDVYFSKSTPKVKASVLNRFRQELAAALAMLAG